MRTKILILVIGVPFFLLGFFFNNSWISIKSIIRLSLNKYITKTDSIKFKDDDKNFKMLASYPKQGIYYYYYKNFNPENFSKPKEVIPVIDGRYTIFIYNQAIPSFEFTQRRLYNENKVSISSIKIEDDPGDMFEMMILGFNFKPQYYVYRFEGCPNSYEGKCINICKFDFDNDLQIKYTAHPWTGEIVKQMEFNNGSIGFPNACNPDWIPGVDI